MNQTELSTTVDIGHIPIDLSQYIWYALQRGADIRGEIKSDLIRTPLRPRLHSCRFCPNLFPEKTCSPCNAFKSVGLFCYQACKDQKRKA